MLTSSGNQLLKLAARVATALEEELFGCLSTDDKARFQEMVQRIEASTLACD